MKKKFPSSVYQRIGEIIVIFTKAVRKAQAENRKLGLPNVYCKESKLFVKYTYILNLLTLSAIFIILPFIANLRKVLNQFC